MMTACEHNRQLMSVGYARCLDCGAETTLMREAAQAPEPAHVTLVPLTDADRKLIRDALEAWRIGWHRPDDWTAPDATHHAQVMQLMGK